MSNNSPGILPGILFVISAPAGTGKTTLVSQLTAELPQVVTSVSFTTRKARPDEVEGMHYYFVTKERFAQKVAAGEFLESVTLYGDNYGTSKKWVEEQMQRGKHVILTIDTQGAMQLKRSGALPAIYIFIQPPSLEVLKERLMGRQTETLEVIQARLKWAEQEMKAAQFYDYDIVNDELPQAYDALRSIVIAEEHRVRGEKDG